MGFRKRYGFFDAVDPVALEVEKYQWLDNFDRAAVAGECQLGANWSFDKSSAIPTYEFITVGGEVILTSPTGGAAGFPVSLIPGIPRPLLAGIAQYCQFKVTNFIPSSTPFSVVGPAVLSIGSHVAGSRRDYYPLVVFPSMAMQLWRTEVGNGQTVLNAAIGTLALGDTIRMEARPFSNRNELAVLKNGVVVYTYTDSSAGRIPLGVEGHPTIHVSYIGTGFGNCDQVVIDDFECGEP